MTTTITTALPTRGPSYDKTKPETRQAWLDFRRNGITATEIRDWGNGSRRRDIIMRKVTGDSEDLSHIPAVHHGNVREAAISAWAHDRFGITPCDAVYSHPENPRHLASPDGITISLSTGDLEVGTPDAIVLEIKTSAHDLTPGAVDADGVLLGITPGEAFDRANYYTQMQWQMYVMNAAMTLFVHERHTGQIDPETGTFTPDGPPQFAWVPRDQATIDRLVAQADTALAEIDAARVAATIGGMPPASDLPPEHALLVAELLAARDAEAVAKAAKDKAWKALQGLYLGGEDVKIEGGFATVTVSTSERWVDRFDEAEARARAPKAMAAHDALVARYTTAELVKNQTLTITRPKG